MERLVALLGTIGASPSETDDERLRRALLVGAAVLMSVLAVFWGVLYIAFGEPLGGAIPLTYTFVSLTSVIVLTLTRRYDVFRFAQLGMALVLPFALMVFLGGFIPSSMVAAWAFVAPLGALAFAGPREALRWFAAYIVLVVLVGVGGGATRVANNLPSALVGGFFILNIAAVSSVAFAAL